MKKVAVVIPIYKEILSDSEEKSLIQVKKILGGYNFIFFGPNNLKLDNYKKILPDFEWLGFENNYFNSVDGYSALMLSPTFYKKFFSYEYILIYQLDAWVFKNDLETWCNKGYDYIGAPWISKPPLTKGKPKFDLSPYFVNRVGNGGFSLRKVKSHYRNCLIFRPLLKKFVKNEDMFWGLLLYFLNPFFRRPKAKEALNFAFEMEPRKAYKMTNHKLPFGVHAWEKYDAEFWKEWIK